MQAHKKESACSSARPERARLGAEDEGAAGAGTFTCEIGRPGEDLLLFQGRWQACRGGTAPPTHLRVTQFQVRRLGRWDMD